MGHQTKDSKFCEYGLFNPENAVASPDKQHLLTPPAKKPVLRDLQNVNATLASQSVQLSVNKAGMASDSVKPSDAKIIANDSLLNQDRSPVSKTGNGHLVYVRRKPEIEPATNRISNGQYGANICPQLRNTNCQDETAPRKIQLDHHGICTKETPSFSQASSVGLSSKRSSNSKSLEKPNNVTSPAHLNYPHSSPVLSSPARLNQHWQERYNQMQNILRILDQSDQHGYMQMLMSLSSVELSRIAVELERRSIQLSLEEARELNRVRVLDVLEKLSK